MLDRVPPEGLTFDDVLLVPARSGVLPAEADTSTWFTRRIRLNIPITSAAMDTVTESQLAVALARQGGLGVIHRNQPIERQTEEVDKVKRSESGMIVDPVTIRPRSTIAEALALMSKYRISGLPVTEGPRLVGIVTNRDLRFQQDTSRPVGEVMTRENLITVPVGTQLEDAERMLQQHRVEKLLVVDGGYMLKGLITVKDIQKKLQYPRAAKDEHGRLRVGAAVGATGDFLERAVELKNKNVDVLVVDTAHGHSERVIAAVGEVRRRLGDEVELVAGNVGTYDGARELAGLGIDAIKVGIGPGSICTTRVVTGTGVPQLTAIADCAKAVREFEIPVIADGGIKYSGDIAKAIAAGASTVMIGSLFAGTDESPGETVLYQGRSFKSYRGMGSLGAMAGGSADRYAQDAVQPSAEGEDAVARDGAGRAKMVPEGVEGRVPYKGPLAALVEQLVGGLRSGMGYCGCRTIEEMRQRARFLRVTAAGFRESHVHDVIITKEAPNYRLE